MSTITDLMEKGKQLEDRINGFLKNHHASGKLRKAGAYKEKGIPVINVMSYLLKLTFTKKSMYMNYRNGTNNPGFGKDVVYRLLNSVFIDWSIFLLYLALSVIKPIRVSTRADRLCALIIDDTLYERARSKKVELLAKVHDHASKAGGRFKRGFRLLTLGWTDGATFIPLTFRHLSSSDSKSRYNEMNKGLDKRTNGYKARRQAVSTATEVLLEMLDRAKKLRVPAYHVLFDSWFSFPSTMIEIIKKGFTSVGRLKDTPKIKYLVGDGDGKEMTLREIYRANRKRRGNSKYLLSVDVSLYNKEDEIADARIVFVRNKINRKEWIALCSTDMRLAEEEIIALYGKRWDVEVFFKICKSYLCLRGESQGLSYDSITAHTAIVMTRYIIIANDKRLSEDHRTISEMFHAYYDEMPDVSFSQAMHLIFDCLRGVLADCLFLSEEEISSIIDSFMDKLSFVFKDFLHNYFDSNKPLRLAG